MPKPLKFETVSTNYAIRVSASRMRRILDQNDRCADDGLSLRQQLEELPGVSCVDYGYTDGLSLDRYLEPYVFLTINKEGDNKKTRAAITALIRKAGGR